MNRIYHDHDRIRNTSLIKCEAISSCRIVSRVLIMILYREWFVSLGKSLSDVTTIIESSLLIDSIFCWEKDSLSKLTEDGVFLSDRGKLHNHWKNEGLEDIGERWTVFFWCFIVVWWYVWREETSNSITQGHLDFVEITRHSLSWIEWINMPPFNGSHIPLNCESVIWLIDLHWSWKRICLSWRAVVYRKDDRENNVYMIKREKMYCEKGNGMIIECYQERWVWKNVLFIKQTSNTMKWQNTQFLKKEMILWFHVFIPVYLHYTIQILLTWQKKKRHIATLGSFSQTSIIKSLSIS